MTQILDYQDLLKENERLRQELARIKTSDYYEIQVSKEEARTMIMDYFEKKKRQGHREFDRLSMILELHLPPKQINTILDELEDEGIIPNGDD